MLAIRFFSFACCAVIVFLLLAMTLAGFAFAKNAGEESPLQSGLFCAFSASRITC
jgi:hypothetical protein